MHRLLRVSSVRILHGGLRPRPRSFVFRSPTGPPSCERNEARTYRHRMKLYTLVCAASFTVRAYSCDRMPFSSVSRAPSPRSRGTIDRQDTIRGISRDESSHLADHRTFIATGGTPASLPTCFRDRTTVKSVLSSCLYFIFPPAISILLYRFPFPFFSFSLSLFLSPLYNVGSSVLFCFSFLVSHRLFSPFLGHSLIFRLANEFAKSRRKLASCSTWVNVSFQNTTILTTVAHVHIAFHRA